MPAAALPTDTELLDASLTLDMATAAARLDAAPTYAAHRNAQADYSAAREQREALRHGTDPAAYARENDWRATCAEHDYCNS